MNKIDSLKNFFNNFSLYYINNNEEYNNNIDKLILNDDNYNYLTSQLENNYITFSSDLNNEIDENFTNLNCEEYLNNTSNIKIYTKIKYSTELNYSKYNFNFVKFRTEISNSRKYTEIYEQLFDDLNYNNIIDSAQITEIDNIINTQNIINIDNASKYKIKQIKEELFSLLQETFDNFGKDFINKIIVLTNIFEDTFNLFDNILNNDKTSNNKITEIYEYILNKIEKFLDDFNITNNIINIFNNYFSLIDNEFNNYIANILNLKSNNLFYSIPKLILRKIFLERRNKIKAEINQFSNKYNLSSIGFIYDIDTKFDILLNKYYSSFELNKSYDYFELFENYSNNYINNLITNITYIKNITENKFNMIANNFIKNIKTALIMLKMIL